jgi:hypothetical protein
MDQLPELRVRHLLAKYETFKNDDEVKANPTLPSVIVGLCTIKHFLGDNWINRNISPSPKRRGYMNITLDETPEDRIRSFRITDVAEMLINLQDVEGFGPAITRMKTEPETESALAELRVGRLLYINDAAFRFVAPRGKAGDNYDLEITYPDGTLVCGETKCKVESTEIDRDTIESALGKARKQLPEDRPGIIFLMIPGHWLEGDGPRLMVETATAFFNKTRSDGPDVRANTRIASIKYYAEPTITGNGMLGQGHRFKEMSNPFNKLHPGRDWDLFHYRPTGDSWNALPEKWIRLINFPHELGKHGKV